MDERFQTSWAVGGVAEPDLSLIARRHASVLGFLELVFVVRVVAQFIQSRSSVGWLPGFDAFQSGALPYWALAVGQVAIVGIQSWVVVGVVRHRRVLKGLMRSTVGSFAAVYFTTMLVRLLAGATVASGHSWLDNPLPSTFHLVLASFIGVWVHYSAVMEDG